MEVVVYGAILGVVASTAYTIGYIHGMRRVYG